MIFQKYPPKMLPISIILIFLQFAHFPLPIYGGAGGGVGPSHSSGKGVERKVGEDERHNFIISIAIKNCKKIYKIKKIRKLKKILKNFLIVNI